MKKIKLDKIDFSKFDPDKELPKVKTGTSRFRLKMEKIPWRAKRKFKKSPEHSYLIEMLFSNGCTKEYVITTKEETFDLAGRTYYLRYEDARYNLTMGQYKLFYHDDCCVPIDLEILKKLDKDPDTPGTEKAFFSVTPSNIKGIIRMKYIEMLAKAQDMERILRIVLFLSAVSCIGIVLIAITSSGVINLAGGG